MSSLDETGRINATREDLMKTDHSTFLRFSLEIDGIASAPSR